MHGLGGNCQEYSNPCDQDYDQNATNLTERLPSIRIGAG